MLFSVRYIIMSLKQGPQIVRNHMRAFLKYEHGFSLIEAALGLAIMATVAGASIPLLTQTLESKKNQITRDHQAYLLNTIGLYAAKTKRLPCPAETADDGYFGTCTTKSSVAYKGYIPYKDLGIPHALTKDGFGNPMHLVTDPKHTLRQYEFKTPPLSQIRVHTFIHSGQRDEAHKRQLDDYQTAALVIWSEGKSKGRSPKGRSERQNEAADSVFHDALLSSHKDNPHRHILKWIAFEHLYFIHGKG